MNSTQAIHCYFCLIQILASLIGIRLNSSFGVYLCMNGLKRLLSESRCQSEWNSVYMLIVLIIAALLLITIVKPMFKNSQNQIREIKKTTQ